MQLTEWFPASVKPVRPGVYQQRCGFGEELGYQHWDGRGWSGWHSTASSAAKDPDHPAYSTAWRGIAFDPKHHLPDEKADEQTDNHTGICEVTE